MICALCGRDFWSSLGRELVLAPWDPHEWAVVCWICGDEHAARADGEGFGLRMPL